MKTTQTDSEREFPISLSLGGTPIGGARAIEDEGPGVFRFEGLDFIARVFFAERIGPGGPEDTMLKDLCVLDRSHHRTMRAMVAKVRHFSSGTGELELAGTFDENDP